MSPVRPVLRSAICLRFEMARLQGSSYSKCHRPKADLFPIIADAVQSSEKSLCPSPAAGDWSQPFAGKNYVGRVAKSHLFDFRKALGCPGPIISQPARSTTTSERFLFRAASPVASCDEPYLADATCMGLGFPKILRISASS